MKRIMITGASGTLGSLLLAEYLEEGRSEYLTTPLRYEKHEAALLKRAEEELARQGRKIDPDAAQRLWAPIWPEDYQDREMRLLFEAAQPDYVFHAAGCLHYFDAEALAQGNEILTAALLRAAESVSIGRFIYISTAFSSGYRVGPIPEKLHVGPSQSEGFEDPTLYTLSKRRAETRVADSDLDWIILRPSIVVGNSVDGHYTGRRYGIYQLWTGVERHLLRERPQEVHYIASDTPTPLIHQDAFASATLFAADAMQSRRVCHLTSPGPSTREVADLFFNSVLGVKKVHYYSHLDDVPISEISRSQRSFLAMASTNIEISNHRWEFETAEFDRLQLQGLDLTNPTLASLTRCQNAFVRSSPRIQKFLSESEPTRFH